MDLKDIINNPLEYEDKTIELNGWIRNHRPQKEFGFITFNDGTTHSGIQIVYDNSIDNFNDISHLLVGSSLNIQGNLIKRDNNTYEVKANSITVLGKCPEDYPIQPKRHTKEFLRENAYLRSRTNLFSAVFKIRSVTSYAIHEFFQNRNFTYIHTPIITSSDCEGAGEMFQVTTLDIEHNKDINYNDDFFGKKTSLTVSGQLQAEPMALAFKKVYTFGPTFRAENSNTKTHASEFWMIEPEMAFTDLFGDMEIMEEMLKYVIKYVLENAKEEMLFLDNFVEKGLIEKLEKLITSKFTKITHEECIKILLESNEKFEFEPKYGEDIAKEHEKYITQYFNGPVFIYNWPKDIKAFYMKQNDDGKTVAAVDLEVPGAGELMGGSQREDDYDKLLKRMQDMNIDASSLDWYLNLRKYGGCIHSGFGMGFERLLIYITGVDNIRDVILYPRTPKNCDY